MFDYFVDRLYPTELEIKNTTNTAAYFDLHHEIDSQCLLERS
jgi:hypothetical protein